MIQQVPKSSFLKQGHLDLALRSRTNNDQPQKSYSVQNLLNVINIQDLLKQIPPKNFFLGDDTEKPKIEKKHKLDTEKVWSMNLQHPRAARHTLDTQAN